MASEKSIAELRVSMKSGLGDRNNRGTCLGEDRGDLQVSMKSGLGDRNNMQPEYRIVQNIKVSMKSGLGDRNNQASPVLR